MVNSRLQPHQSTMRSRCTVLLIPPSLNSTLFHQIANPCICHTSKESPAKSSACHTSKNRSRKFFPCHTYETPHPVSLLLCGPHRLRSSRRPAFGDHYRFAPLFSIASAMPLRQPFSFHAFALLPGGG